MDNVIPLRPHPVAEPEPLWREALGQQLREERVDRGERIADVAERAGVSPQYLSEVERGRKDPSSEILSAVSGALGLSVLDLTRRAGQHLARPGPRTGLPGRLGPGGSVLGGSSRPSYSPSLTRRLRTASTTPYSSAACGVRIRSRSVSSRI